MRSTPIPSRPSAMVPTWCPLPSLEALPGAAAGDPGAAPSRGRLAPSNASKSIAAGLPCSILRFCAVFVSSWLRLCCRALMGCGLLVLRCRWCAHRRWPVLRSEGEPLQALRCGRWLGIRLIQSLGIEVAVSVAAGAESTQPAGGPSRHSPRAVGIKDKAAPSSNWLCFGGCGRRSRTAYVGTKPQ